MAEESPPPRKEYGFKEREFKRDNAPVTPLNRTLTVQELAKMAEAKRTQAGGASRPDGPAAGGSPVSGHEAPPTQATPKAGDPNDVHALLAANRAMERKSGGDQIEIRKVSSRRRRDFWLVFIPVEFFFACLAVTGRDNPLQFVCAIAGGVIVGVTLPWVMFHLMDKY